MPRVQSSGKIKMFRIERDHGQFRNMVKEVGVLYICPYCEELEKGYLEIGDFHFGNRMLYLSPNFVVFPTVGQIVEGYLLIASRVHYLGIGQVPDSLYDELEEVKGLVKNVLIAEYGPSVIFFEHGPASEVRKGGCCIEHAHLHCVPVEVDIFPELSAHFQPQQIYDFARLKNLFANGIPYLYWENAQGQRFVFAVAEAIIPQYLRQIIANKIGKIERWDWHTCPGWEEMQKTLATLKPHFQKLQLK